MAQEIVATCKKVGFVYIINHSLPDTLLDEAFHWSRLFFELPTAEKLRAPHPEGWAVHRGYSWPGLEKVSQAVSADNDEERTAELREIPDIKVSPARVLVDGIVVSFFGAARLGITSSNVQ
jgi:isopenicillin N synthase-like dioxygenase